MNLPLPVIVIPGITGTTLRDEYPIDPEYVWRTLSKKYERVALHPDDLRYESIEPARVMPDKIIEPAYKELVEELRHNLRPHIDVPVPVYAFNYDWRMPLELTEKKLSDFIIEVKNRTRLLRHYHDQKYDDDPKVNIVAHSMGGLIVTGYLNRIAEAGDSVPVKKVVTLATPYQGSFEAIIKIITGTANLGEKAPSSREREMARITPALYYLLPSFEGGVDFADENSDSLYDPSVWQRSVIDTLADFVRTRGLPTKTPLKAAEELFSKMLDKAHAHRKRIDKFRLDSVGFSKSDWMAVVGVDSTTRVRLRIRKRDNEPQLDLSSSDRMNEWGNEDATKARLTGDGTVPFEGAIPLFLNEEQIICVTPDDYGYWEIEDKLLTKIAGFHGILPNMNLIHRLIVRFFTGSEDHRGNTWGRPPPGIGDAEWDTPLTLASKSD